MSQSLEEMKPYLVGNAANLIDPKVEARLREAAKQMTELLADEKWETYRRHVEELKKFHVKREESLRSTVLATLGMDNEEARKARIDFLVAQARATAYNECLTICETIIAKSA